MRQKLRVVAASGFDQVIITAMLPGHLNRCSEHVLKVGFFKPDRETRKFLHLGLVTLYAFEDIGFRPSREISLYVHEKLSRPIEDPL